MNSLLKKYKYFLVSTLLHFIILMLVLFNFANNYKDTSITFTSKGSKGIELFKASIVQEKGNIKKQIQGFGELGKSKDEYHTKSVIQDQSLLKYKAPKYPRVALLNKEQGEVTIRLLVEKSGEIKKIVIYKSSNYPLLDNAVIDVAKYWNIKRSLDEISWIQVKVNFVIE